MPTDEKTTEAEKERREAALAQNQLAPNAVPEQRPQAFAPVNPQPDHPVTEKLKESGALNDEPMGQEAYDRAASKEQATKASKASQTESIRVGTRVRVVDGEYDGSFGAVVDVTYENFDETQKAHSGDPAVARFAKVSDVLVRTRGGRHALLSLKPDQVEEVSVLGIARHEEG